MMDYIKILILIGVVIVAAIVHVIIMHERVGDIEGKFNFIDRYKGRRGNRKGVKYEEPRINICRSSNRGCCS